MLVLRIVDAQKIKVGHGRATVKAASRFAVNAPQRVVQAITAQITQAWIVVAIAAPKGGLGTKAVGVAMTPAANVP